jgi:hypothetical protein
VVLDEGEPHGSCLAKKAVAFYKISRSMSRRRFSSRSRRTSARRPPSVVAAGVAGNFLSQKRMVETSMPRLWPAWVGEYPCSWTSLTADSLNLRLYVLRGIGHLLPRACSLSPRPAPTILG